MIGDNPTSTDYLNPVGYTDVTDTSDSQITWMATVAIKYNGSDQDVFNYFTNPTISQSMFGDVVSIPDLSPTLLSFVSSTQSSHISDFS